MSVCVCICKNKWEKEVLTAIKYNSVAINQQKKQNEKWRD